VSTLRRNYSTTLITEILFIGSYLLCFRVVAVHLGSVGFGEYAVARRTLAALTPLGALGLDLAVARSIAHSLGRPDSGHGYVPVAIAIQLAAMAIISLPLIAFSDLFAAVFFGGRQYRDLVLSLPLLIIGGGLQGIAYGYFRGRMQIQRANLLLFCIHAATPLLAVLLITTSVSAILFAIGLAWIAISLLFLAMTQLQLDKPKERALELARFGIPRVPGDLLQLLLFALPAILVVHVADIAVAGSVALGVAALGMIGAGSSAVGMVLLPVASRLIATGSRSELRNLIIDVARIWGLALVVLTSVVELLAGPIVSVYLGPGLVRGGTELLRVLMLGAVPWGAYVSLKSIIDAQHVRPVNARNMLLACLVFCVALGPLWIAFGSLTGIVGAFVLSLYAIGLLTARQAWLIASGAWRLTSAQDVKEEQSHTHADAVAWGRNP
jgi:O-antigen/teichoic acid export membrane protein